MFRQLSAVHKNDLQGLFVGVMVFLVAVGEREREGTEAVDAGE